MAAESLYKVDTPAERWGAAVDRLLTMARPSETRPELAVVQGFTRRSAQRAEVLRARLGARDVSAVEVGADSDASVGAGRFCAVITDRGESAWAARRLAARENIPLLRLGMGSPGGDDEAEPVLLYTLTGVDADVSNDAAFASVYVRPIGPGEPQARVVFDGTSIMIGHDVGVAITAGTRGEVAMAVTPAPVGAAGPKVGAEVEVRIERDSYAVSVDGSPLHEIHQGAMLGVRPGTVRLVDAQLD